MADAILVISALKDESQNNYPIRNSKHTILPFMN